MRHTTVPKTKAPKETLTFGTTFTDHMLEVDWEKGDGWQNPLIRCVRLAKEPKTGGDVTETDEVVDLDLDVVAYSPYGPIAMDPASSALHYALEVRASRTWYRLRNIACHAWR